MDKVYREYKRQLSQGTTSLNDEVTAVMTGSVWNVPAIPGNTACRVLHNIIYHRCFIQCAIYAWYPAFGQPLCSAAWLYKGGRVEICICVGLYIPYFRTIFGKISRCWLVSSQVSHAGDLSLKPSYHSARKSILLEILLGTAIYGLCCFIR